jgi:hypothetical protein
LKVRRQCQQDTTHSGKKSDDNPEEEQKNSMSFFVFRLRNSKHTYHHSR